MSTWADVDDDDISVDKDQQEINIVVSTDDFGVNYINLTFKQIYDILKQIEDHS